MKRLTKRINFPNGTCTYDFSDERIHDFITDHKAGVKAIFASLCHLEDILDRSYVTPSNMTHKRITYMRPIKHDYSDKDHPHYYKYTCPVCDMVENKHQVIPGETNCALCGVNLLWDEEGE